jgi:tRNA(Ile)-lysidine synthase
LTSLDLPLAALLPCSEANYGRIRIGAMKSLKKRVLDFIRELQLIAPGDRVGVAVSGGADSVALLHILQSIREELGVKLAVLHFDHCLRGAESDADAQFAGELAHKSGLRFLLDHQDVAAAAKLNKWNLEDAARRLRYAFFERVIRDGQATRIAVAHTADDQAETVLAHLIRGTGPTGLGGIYPAAGSVVRPLLAVRRHELREYLRERKQSWREDSSNRDVHRLRARIRARLLPLLEHDFSPHTVERLCELARLSREEQEFWNALTDDRFRALVSTAGSAYSIRAGDLLAPLAIPQSPATSAPRPRAGNGLFTRSLTERLIRKLYQQLRGTRQGLAASHVEQVIRLAETSASGRRAELPGGVLVEKSYGVLTFSKANSIANQPSLGSEQLNKNALSASYAYPVQLLNGGCATVSVPELGSRFRLKMIDWTCAERETRQGCSALDAARLQMPLILRNWRPGDAYRPRGRRQIHKLKHMFAEGRIPARERAAWPVLESAGRVVWARGMAPAQEFCAGDGTASGVLIEEERL